jgi:chorismate dehydratase
MSRLRISAISYLNTAPLMWDFERGEAGRLFDISYTLPSQCAAALAAGTADIGIIPSAAYATIPGLVVVPGVAIAAREPVRSILLVSQKPLNDVKTVALDTSSLTSVALTRILFAKWLGGPRVYKSMSPQLDAMLAECDAGLLIGDPALLVDRSRYHTLDLAEEWQKRTGKPFVFAFWAVREAALEALPPDFDLGGIFRRSRDHGLAPSSLNQIVREWAPRLGLTEADVKSYLTRNIYFELDSACVEGLMLFYNYAAECGALPAVRQLRLLPTEQMIGRRFAAAEPAR